MEEKREAKLADITASSGCVGPPPLRVCLRVCVCALHRRVRPHSPEHYSPRATRHTHQSRHEPDASTLESVTHGAATRMHPASREKRASFSAARTSSPHNTAMALAPPPPVCAPSCLTLVFLLLPCVCVPSRRGAQDVGKKAEKNARTYTHARIHTHARTRIYTHKGEDGRGAKHRSSRQPSTRDNAADEQRHAYTETQTRQPTRSHGRQHMPTREMIRGGE